MDWRLAAHVMQFQHPASDRAYRYGGEEFALPLPECGPEAASRVAGRIRQALEQAALGPDGDVTVSAGTAAWRPRKSAAALVERADTALYTAKDAGCNRCHSADVRPGTTGLGCRGHCGVTLG